jgi:hypothetical protein
MKIATANEWTGNAQNKHAERKTGRKLMTCNKDTKMEKENRVEGRTTTYFLKEHIGPVQPGSGGSAYRCLQKQVQGNKAGPECTNYHFRMRLAFNWLGTV